MSKTETLKEIWEILEREHSHIGWTKSDLPLVVPFELKPEDFIAFAKEDLEENKEKSRVNALSNIKRAIDCRIMSLLYFFCIYDKAKKENWNFPESADFLLHIGVLAPNILKKINRKRNELEHDFKNPTFEEVTDYFDIASLFLAFTNPFLQKTCMDFEIGTHEEHFPWVSINLNYKKQFIHVKLVNEKSSEEIKIISNDEDNYLKILRYLVKCIVNH